MIEFSIIVPIYNAEKYLKKMIDSVLAQIYENWELILINDGSVDDSIRICREYAKENPRISVIEKGNSGVSESRNVGIEKSKGKYLIFLDADDWIDEKFLISMHEYCEINDEALIICNYFDVFGNTEIISKPITENYLGKRDIRKIIEISLQQSQWNKDEWYGNLRTVWGKCFNSGIVKKNRIWFKKYLKFGEDMIFVLEYLNHIEHVYCIDIPLYYYRFNYNSAVNSRRWEGSEQGMLYFRDAEQIVGKYVDEDILSVLWLETAINDWDSILNSDINLIEKYKIFKSLRDNSLYKRFCQVRDKHNYINKKHKIYVCLIKKNYMFLLFLLNIIRNKNNHYKYKQLNLE